MEEAKGNFMKVHKALLLLSSGILLTACGGNGNGEEGRQSAEEVEDETEEQDEEIAEESGEGEEEALESTEEPEETDELEEYYGYYLFEEDTMHHVVHIHEDYFGEYHLPQADYGSTLWTIIENEEVELTDDTYKTTGPMLDAANYQEWENPYTPTSIEEVTVEYSLAELEEARIDPEELRETTSDSYSDPVDLFARLYEEFYLSLSEEQLVKEEAVADLWGEYIYDIPGEDSNVVLILESVEEVEDVSPTYEMTPEELEEEGVIGFYDSIDEGDGEVYPVTYLEAIEFVPDTNKYYIHSRLDIGTGWQDPIVYVLDGDTLIAEQSDMRYERVQD